MKSEQVNIITKFHDQGSQAQEHANQGQEMEIHNQAVNVSGSNDQSYQLIQSNLPQPASHNSTKKDAFSQTPKHLSKKTEIELQNLDSVERKLGSDEKSQLDKETSNFPLLDKRENDKEHVLKKYQKRIEEKKKVNEEYREQRKKNK